LQTNSNAVLTNAVGHTIRGLGDIRARLVNRGTVKADAVNNTLYLRGADLTNQGWLKAIAGGWLTVDGAHVFNAGGEIRGEGGYVVLAHGARITEGVLSSAAGGAFYTSGNARLDYLVNRATVRVPGGDTLTLTGPSVTNDGTVAVDYNQAAAVARVSVDGDVTLRGAGDMFLYAGSPWSQVATTPGSVLRNADSHMIHGFGEISAHLVNSGIVRADVPNATLSVTDPEFLNTGTAEAVSGGLLYVPTPAANYAAGTLTGGRWRVHAASTIRLDGAAITTNQAFIDLDGINSRLIRDGAWSDALAGLANNAAGGWLELRNGRSLTTAGAFQNAGDLVLGTGGTLIVGGGGSFDQLPGAHLRFAIGGRLAADIGRLQVTGTAHLAGVITADTTGGFAPVLGDTFLVMTYSSKSGAFDHFEAPLVNGLRLVPTVYSNRVVLTAAVPTVEVEELPGPPAALSLVARFEPGGGAVLELALPAAADVRLELHDLRGRRVASLCHGPLPAGVRSFRLGTGAAEAPAPRAGIYFARAVVRLDGRVEERAARVVMMR
jgi:hypothetical protein